FRGRRLPPSPLFPPRRSSDLGHLDVFFGLILPHGLMELTAIFIAAAAGLKLFWAWVSPGPRTRSRALAEEGRALFTVALGLVVRSEEHTSELQSRFALVCRLL